jgi:hypothetical protein
MLEIRIENDRVSRSVNPTRHTNAKRMWVSSGPVPLYSYSNNLNNINLSVILLKEAKR